MDVAEFLKIISKLQDSIEKKDLVVIKPLFEELKDKVRGEFKPDLKQMIIAWMDSVKPLIINGQIEENWFSGDEAGKEWLRGEIEKRRPLYYLLEKVFTNSFSQYLTFKTHDVKSIEAFVDAMLIWRLLCAQTQYSESRKTSDTLTAGLDSFKSVFELLSKILDIIGGEIYYEREGSEMIDKSNGAVRKYLFRIDRRFRQLFYKTIRKEFRDAFAHNDWIELDSTHFYFLKTPSKILTKTDLECASVDLICFLIFLLSIFTTSLVINLKDEIKNRLNGTSP